MEELGKLLAASQGSVKSRNAVRFARIRRLIERDLAQRWQAGLACKLMPRSALGERVKVPTAK
jgi:galactokinase